MTSAFRQLLAFRQMMRDDRERLGVSAARASWLLDIRVREYRELEAGKVYPDFERWRRMCALFGRPQRFEGA